MEKLNNMLQTDGLKFCHTRVASLQHLKNAERRGARCANVSNAVQSPRTPCNGVYV